MNNRSGLTLHTAHPTPNVFADALCRMKRDDELVTRPARRTLATMEPGYVQQPVLRLAPNVRFLPTAAQEDSCGLCGSWSCDGTDCRFGASVPAAARVGLRSVA
ncbi:hypothetical protein [Streptomyces sp. NPDC056169]|uniref:hypothetical protein n=1 Tax=Streptomyces sp. NPDC056169 TaxID=3345734 RepID=UPI0035E064DE